MGVRKMGFQIEQSSADCVRFVGGLEWLFCLFCASDSTALETDAHGPCAHMCCVPCPKVLGSSLAWPVGNLECARDDGVMQFDLR
jgi:hypothetical protein